MNIPVIDKSKTTHGIVAVDGKLTSILFFDYIMHFENKTLVLKLV